LPNINTIISFTRFFLNIHYLLIDEVPRIAISQEFLHQLETANAFILLSLTGIFFAMIGILISAFAYQGKSGKPYSPLNHFISELGEVGVSRLAWAFNLGLILSGICLTPACIALGLSIPGMLAKIAMVAGVVTAVGLTLVGFFPMNHMEPHAKAALTFFRGGLIMVSTFSLAIAFQPGGPLALLREYSLVGLPAVFSFGGFLLLMRLSRKKDDDNPLTPLEKDRPRFWLMPAIEWMIFLTIVLWFLWIAAGLI
jgi:hypothetical membrane protein